MLIVGLGAGPSVGKRKPNQREPNQREDTPSRTGNEGNVPGNADVDTFKVGTHRTRLRRYYTTHQYEDEHKEEEQDHLLSLENSEKNCMTHQRTQRVRARTATATPRARQQ